MREIFGAFARFVNRYPRNRYIIVSRSVPDAAQAALPNFERSTLAGLKMHKGGRSSSAGVLL
jgi:hypothetical protein